MLTAALADLGSGSFGLGARSAPGRFSERCGVPEARSTGMGRRQERERSVGPNPAVTLAASRGREGSKPRRLLLQSLSLCPWQVPMASERRKVKYHWGSTSEGCPSKRSRPREPGNVAASSRPGRRCASRPRGASSPQRLKVRRGDDVARAPRSSVRRRTSSSSSSSSLSSGSGAGGAASPGFLIASPRRLLTSKGSPLHPAHSSLEEMASLRKEACSVKVRGSDVWQTSKSLARGLRGGEKKFGGKRIKNKSFFVEGLRGVCVCVQG